MTTVRHGLLIGWLLAATLAWAQPARVPSRDVAVSGDVAHAGRFDLDALRALPTTELTAGGARYRGVALWTLVEKVAPQPDPAARNAAIAMYVVVTGADGYRAVFSLAELDPQIGHADVLLAYERDATPLGPLGVAKLVVPGDAKAARSVSGVASIELRRAP